jgi:hypothetical protein
MKAFGQFKDSRGIAGTIITPEDIKIFDNDIDFFIAAESGVSHGVSDSEYERAGAIVVKSNGDVLRLADIVVVHDELDQEAFDTINKKKVLLTDVDYTHTFSKLIPMMGAPVSLFSFHQMGLQATDWKSFRYLYLSFLKYVAGEPIDYELITIFSKAKILENGRIVNKEILDIIESI